MTSTLCRIILTVVTCTVDPSTPAPSPAAAIAILTASLGPSRVPAPAPSFEPDWRIDAPPVQTYDRDWPFTGSFAPTWIPTDRWLDGTPRVDPLLYGGYGTPWLFGGTPFGSGLFGGSGRGAGRANGRATRPIARTPAVSPPGSSGNPNPGVRPPLAAPSGSVRTRAGRD